MEPISGPSATDEARFFKDSRAESAFWSLPLNWLIVASTSGGAGQLKVRRAPKGGA